MSSYLSILAPEIQLLFDFRVGAPIFGFFGFSRQAANRVYSLSNTLNCYVFSN